MSPYKSGPEAMRIARAERFDRVARWVAFTVFLLLAFAASLNAQVAGAGTPPVTGYITQFVPPVEYRGWYKDAERCAGRRGDYDGVEWYVVPTSWESPDGRTYAEWRYRERHGTLAAMDPLRNAMEALVSYHRMIVVNADEWRDSTLVMHEALHDILWMSGWRPADTTSAAMHPKPPYGRCAPAVHK